MTVELIRPPAFDRRVLKHWVLHAERREGKRNEEMLDVYIASGDS